MYECYGDIMDMDNVIETNHSLIQHKISILRNKNIGTNESWQS